MITADEIAIVLTAYDEASAVLRKVERSAASLADTFAGVETHATFTRVQAKRRAVSAWAACLNVRCGLKDRQEPVSWALAARFWTARRSAASVMQS